MPVIMNVAEARKDLALATLSAITHADRLGNRSAAQQWRNLVAVDLSFCTSPLSEEIRDEGRAQGLAHGRAEDVLLVLGVRGIEISDGTREKVTACTDPELLSQWLVRAIRATTAEEIFGEEPSADRPSWTARDLHARTAPIAVVVHG